MFEYKVTTHMTGSLIGTGSLEERLNEIGAEGWEVVSVMLMTYSQDITRRDDTGYNGFHWKSVHQIVAKRSKQ
jgi:hypothetical protein